MALRQTTGFVESLLRLVGLDRAVPDFGTLSRRQKTRKVNIPYRGPDGPLHLLVDSTGIKVEGEGAWNARKHGGTKRPSPRFLEPVAKSWLDWRKIHIGIDEKSLEIRAAEFTTGGIGDAPMLPEVLDRIPPDQEIATGEPSRTPMVPSTPASVTTPSPPEGPPRSGTLSDQWRSCPHSRPARTPGPGSPTPPVPSHDTKSCGRRNASVEPSGDDGADTTAGAAQKPGCTASSCRGNVRSRETSTVRSQSSRSGSFAGSPGPMAFARSFLNRLPALGTPVTEVAGHVCPGMGKLRPSADLCNRAA
jgi:hypothetical protein